MPHSNSTPPGANCDTLLSPDACDNSHIPAIPTTIPIPTIPTIGYYTKREGVWIWLRADGTFITCNRGDDAYLDTDALGTLFDGRA